MTPENWIGIGTIFFNLLIGTVAIINISISNKTIKANKELNKENIGKNRVIYATEQMDAGNNDKAMINKLNGMLNSGNYTVLSAFVNLGNTGQTRFVIGKIKP